MLGLESGALFGGRYEVIKCIGSGGMGAVYLARDPRYNNFLVALKVLYPGIIKTPEMRERFRTEIIASYRIHHRNIVRAYEYFDEETLQAYAMEYVKGMDLQQRMREGGVSAEECTSILRQVAGGLHAIHSEGILHRDLKPENVLVTDRGLVKIADFGVARLRGQAASITQVGAMVGTPKYFAPEYVETGECDHRGDIYALGVIGYELMAGMSPFRSASRVSMMVERFNTQIEPLDKVVPWCPPELAAIIEKAMAVSIARRYQSADEMRRDLEALEEGEPLIFADIGGFAEEEEPEPAAEQLLVSTIDGNQGPLVEPVLGADSSLNLIVILASTIIVLVGIGAALAFYALVWTKQAPVGSVPEGRYEGRVLGFADSESELPLTILRSSDETQVFFKYRECGWATLSDSGQFACGPDKFQLQISFADGETATGTLSEPSSQRKGSWSAMKKFETEEK